MTVVTISDSSDGDSGESIVIVVSARSDHVSDSGD